MDKKKIELQEKPVITFAEFIEKMSPSDIYFEIEANIIPYTTSAHSNNPNGIVNYQIKPPEIQIYCKEKNCKRTMYHHCISEDTVFRYPFEAKSFFWEYMCANCQKTIKKYALSIEAKFNDKPIIKCCKHGEFPSFGDPTPDHLSKIVGRERDNFFKGKNCENQGLGIGAYAYYRRIVENHKNKIFDLIIRTMKELGGQEEQIKALELAKADNQFLKSLESAKDLIPNELYISTHNPLTLLHKTLSKGLHEDNDEHCLTLARAVRIILVELSEKINFLHKKNATLKDALSDILNNNNPQGKK